MSIHLYIYMYRLFPSTRPPQKEQFFVQNDTKCCETNEISIFRFLVFELFLILLTIFKCFYRPKMEKNDVSKDAQCSETDV